MQEQDPLYEHVRAVMAEVMAVLYSNGQKELHVGAMMRLLGVDEETAKHAQPKTVQEFFDFMEKYKSKEPTDVTSAVGSIK